MPAIHQFVPVLEPGGTGGHLVEIQRLCHDLGWESEIFAETLKEPWAHMGHHYADYGRRIPAQPGDLLLYHLVIGNPVADWVHDRPEAVAINYQNITPASYYQFWLPEVVPGLVWGRDQLRKMAKRAFFGLTVSEYNRSELVAAGYTDTGVVPILLDPKEFAGEADPVALSRLLAAKDGGGTDVLFVGRFAPNKKHEDMVRGFAAYRQVYDPKARLHFVGGWGTPLYTEAIRQLIHDLGLDDAVELAHGVSPAELASYYEAADVYLCLSEHEGFCVPLMEAWQHRLPIVAYDAAAVPETLGGAGLVLRQKDPLTVAAALDRVATDDTLRDALVAAGTARLATFSLDRTRDQMRVVLERLREQAADMPPHQPPAAAAGPSLGGRALASELKRAARFGVRKVRERLADRAGTSS